MCELVISCCDASEVFQPAKASFDNISTLVDFFVVADFLFAVALARNDRLDAALLEERADGVRVIALVGEELFDAGDQTDAFLRHHTIGGVARREDKGPRPTLFVDHRVDFAVAPSLRKPDRLKISPPFPPLAQRWILTWLLSSEAVFGGSDGPATHSKIFCQTPFSLQREKRL